MADKIDDIELSDFGLRLAHLDGNLDLPAFKDILEHHKFEAELQITEDRTVQIKLIGFYDDKVELGTNIKNFQDKIKSATKLEWQFENHNFHETCVVKDGFQINIFDVAVEITLTLVIV
jgi:uncharacterized protein with von Willebrand factor type A (vWA) domain